MIPNCFYNRGECFSPLKLLLQAKQAYQNLCIMKTLFTYLLAILGLVAMNLVAECQEFTPKSTSGGGFSVESGAQTQETFYCEGQSFDIWETKSGSQYVIAISKAGKEYPVWLGSVTEHNYEVDGKVYGVHQFKSGTYAYFKLTASGYPRAVYLDKN